MRYKKIFLASILFFIVVHSRYFWTGKLGLFDFPIVLLLLFSFIFFTVVLILQIVLFIRENFNISRLYIILLLTSILLITAIKPFGIIDFDKLSGKDLLIASREGGGNCTTTLKLKDTYKFRLRTICFGITDIKGTYSINTDTIFFDINGRREDDFFQFAVIKPSKLHDNKKAIVSYLNVTDSMGLELIITKNNLDQLKQKPNH